MRIVAGSLGGRSLSAPKGQATRPTSERVREACFSILGQPPPEQAVLDLFGGSGALGLEALSRGISYCTFVEKDRNALRSLHSNISTLGVAKQCELLRGDSIRHLQSLARSDKGYYWIFIDPPYASDLATQALKIIADSQLLSEDGQIIVEFERRNPPEPQIGSLVQNDNRRYGDTSIAFYQRNSK